MTIEDLNVLKAHIDQTVRLDCIDGEVIKAKLILVSEEDQDIIFDLICTNRQDKYEKLDRQPAYLLRFQHIQHVEPLQ